MARDIITARGRGPQLKPCASASFCLFPGPWLSPSRTRCHWKPLPTPGKQLDHKTSTWQGRTWFLPHGGKRRRLTGLAQLPQAPHLTIGAPSGVCVLSFLLSLWHVSESVEESLVLPPGASGTISSLLSPTCQPWLSFPLQPNVRFSPHPVRFPHFCQTRPWDAVCLPSSSPPNTASHVASET